MPLAFCQVNDELLINLASITSIRNMTRVYKQKASTHTDFVQLLDEGRVYLMELQSNYPESALYSLTQAEVDKIKDAIKHASFVQSAQSL